MSPNFNSVPDQFTIIESVIFDLTGLSLNVFEIGGILLAIGIINVLFAAPLGERKLSK